MPARTNSAALWAADGPSSGGTSSVAVASNSSAQLDVLPQTKAYAEAARKDRLAAEAARKEMMAQLREQAAADKKAAEEIWRRRQRHEGYAAHCAQWAEYALQAAEHHAGQSHQASIDARYASTVAAQSAAAAAQSAAAAAQSAVASAADLSKVEHRLDLMETGYMDLFDSVGDLDAKVFGC